MKRKKKLAFVVAILVSSTAILLLSFYFFPRVFGSEETKAVYKIQHILNSHISSKSDDIIDLINHIYRNGGYEYKENKLYLSFGLKTGEDITDVLSKASALCNEITAYTKTNATLNSAGVDISIRIEHWAEWSIDLEPMSDSISIGLGYDTSLTQVLNFCKEFETVKIGGYWGYTVFILNDIDDSFFEDFHALKTLVVVEIETFEMEKRLNEAVSGLRERGVEVITTLRKSYQLEKADNEINENCSS